MSYEYRTPVRRRSWVQRNAGLLGFGVVVVLIVLAVAAWISAVKGSQRDVTVLVKDKERVCSSGNSSCQYLIYTDHGTFKDTDSFLYMKFSSSDVYGQIDRGKTYTFKVVGWRLPFFSEYPNVVSIENGG